jgi:hypothetical protein
MRRDRLEQRAAAIERALAVSLNDPQCADLGRLAQATEIHPATRRRIGSLRRLREEVRAGRSLDATEWQLAETLTGALETLLHLDSAPGPTLRLERTWRDRLHHDTAHA